MKPVLSLAAMRRLREGFAAAERKVDELLEKGSFDAVSDLAETYPMTVFPDPLGVWSRSIVGIRSGWRS